MDPFVCHNCCYLLPRFDEVATLFHKLGEGGSPDHGSTMVTAKVILVL